ncbi:MAG: DUF2281 domain-containing protein [Candidatus Firestonebacteria bacterium]|nr:DUF2281 domain-containing protein [Candidatus Firestonebacteria bacterium]
MYSDGLILMEIYNKLLQIPDGKINEVKDFIDFILSRHQIKQNKIVKLDGIWSGKGFEKISNLEKELNNVQKSVTKSIFKKDI